MFLRDASQAIQLVADSVLARPADVAAALGKDEDKDLSKQALRIREDTAGLMGSALSESVRCDAARRAAAGGEAASASRKVWVHSAALAEVRAHAISVRPAAPEHASGGLVYDATTHSLVEAREGDCPTLLSPWGIAMTKAGRIRPRDDALDSRRPSRGSNETMEELVRRSEKEEEESGKRGQPVPAPLAGASRVVVQARVVFGTLECDAGKRVVAPLAELDEAEAVGIEGPAGWRGRQWSHPFGAADASRWGCIAGAQDGEAGDAAGGAADAASSDEEGSDEESRGRGPAASADDADPYAPTAVTSASGLARWWAGEESLARARSLAAVEAAVKADVGASESKDGSGARQGPSRAAVLRRSAVEHAAVRTRMAAARAYAGAAAGSGRQGSQPAVWKDGPSTALLASGPLLGDEGVPSPLAGAEGKAPWSARQETALRGLVARYTHWHEATFEISLVRPAPSWGRSMGLARTGLDGDPRGDSEEGDDDDDDDDDDDEHRAGGEGTSEERRAAALRRDLKRGVRADAPGRSGAGPVGAPRGLEAVLTRLVWEGKGLAGKGLRLFAEATGGVVLRGPDMVPEHGGWRLIGIDEAVPRGAWEADRRAAGAWEAAQGMAVASLTDGTDTDWTLGAEFLATLPAHMAARMGAADVGANHPTAVMSNVALLCRTQGPLMRHWPPAALGVVGNQRHIRAAMRERASWLDVEDDQDAAGGGAARVRLGPAPQALTRPRAAATARGPPWAVCRAATGARRRTGRRFPAPPSSASAGTTAGRACARLRQWASSWRWGRGPRCCWATAAGLPCPPARSTRGSAARTSTRTQSALPRGSASARRAATAGSTPARASKPSLTATATRARRRKRRRRTAMPRMPPWPWKT